MAEQPVIYQTEKIEAETGKNISNLLAWQRDLPGVTLSGYPEAVGKAVVQLGMLPELPSVDIKGEVDDVLEAFQSDRNVLLRTNIKGQQVPARDYEYTQDRQDIVAGLIADYGGLLLNPIIGLLSGLFSDEVEDLDEIEKMHPIKTEWMADFYLHRGKHKNPEKPKFYTSRLFRRVKDKKGKEKLKEVGRIISEYPTGFPSCSTYGYGDTEILLGKKPKLKRITDYICD